MSLLWTLTKAQSKCLLPHEAEGEEAEGEVAVEEGEVSYCVCLSVTNRSENKEREIDRCSKGLFRNVGIVQGRVTEQIHPLVPV